MCTHRTNSAARLQTEAHFAQRHSAEAEGGLQKRCKWRGFLSRHGRWWLQWGGKRGGTPCGLGIGYMDIGVVCERLCVYVRDCGRVVCGGKANINEAHSMQTRAWSPRRRSATEQNTSTCAARPAPAWQQRPNIGATSAFVCHMPTCSDTGSMHAPSAGSACKGRAAYPLYTCTAASVLLGAELCVVDFNRNFAPEIVGIGGLVFANTTGSHATGSNVTSECAAIRDLFQNCGTQVSLISRRVSMPN